MKMLRMVVSGLAGAAALTAAHQFFKKTVPDAPRMDVLGMRSIEQVCEKLGWQAPTGVALYQSALVCDLISNSIYYSPVGSTRGTSAFGRGMSLGLAAGLGALKLPQMLGLGKEPSAKNAKTMAFTVGLYMVGGIAAAVAAQLVPSSRDE